MSADDEILQEFLAEGYENLDRLERELVAFEQNGVSTESIGAIFRTVHTIKGTAGFFGFERLQHVTHVGENLLAKIRDGQLALTTEMVSALLAVVDACRTMLGTIQATGHDGTDDYPALVERLTVLQEVEAAPAPTPAAAELTAHPAPTAPTETPPSPPVAKAAPVVHVEPTPAPATEAHNDTTVRVDIGLLDKLMDLAGELVLARNQLLQVSSASRDSSLVHTAQRIDLITSEMQDGVMKTRMQPIGGVWNKLPRVVRDLSAELGKQVRLELEGKDTGLDRSILEAIKDPLTHIVRNSIDHGIERPEKRTGAGKPAEGVLRLRASHEGGHVMIEISDDGAGIDPVRVKAKALERGIITPERAARMTDTEAVALIFAPGFSTAEKVTNVSGRGVGMDVVRTNIERIGGAVEIDSVPGVGTRIHIKIPLTLAIIPALIVSSGSERYAIPQAGVLELLRIDGSAGRTIEHVDGVPIYRLRGALLPIVYLDEVLGLGRNRSGATVVVLQNEGRPFGMMVDAVQDTEEIVVKPTGKRLRDLATYAGATILGDGRVALILDVRGIAARASVGLAGRQDKTVSVAPDANRRRVLLVNLGGGRRVAIPLDEVARLEEFPWSALERASGVEVVQYRDRLLPLVRLGAALGGFDDAAGDKLCVVVCSTGLDDFGIVVDDIDDIVEERIEITRASTQLGLFGSAVIAGRVTDVVDVPSLAASMGLSPHQEVA
ncbi:MAG: chemotaxis protein CheA [Kofleriaceae bacterium]|nr:chemotaxis protein CheA [Kofleriaceae bacterium]